MFSLFVIKRVAFYGITVDTLDSTFVERLVKKAESIGDNRERGNRSKEEVPTLHAGFVPTANISKGAISEVPTKNGQLPPSNHSRIHQSPTPVVKAFLSSTPNLTTVSESPQSVSPVTTIPSEQSTPTSYSVISPQGKKVNIPIDRFAALDVLYSISDIEEQQKRLNKWLQSFYELQSKCDSNQRIIYIVDPFSGLGNMFRGYFSALVIAVHTDRCVKVKSFGNYVNLFFVPPFPQLTYRGGNYDYRVWKYSQTPNERKMIMRVPFSSIFRSPSFIFSTYSDITLSALNATMYASSLRQLGLAPTANVTLQNDVLGWSVRSIWLRLLFNPNPALCSIIMRHLNILHKRYLIGMQVRLGGTKANYPEREMIGVAGMLEAIRVVKEHMKKTGKTGKDVYIFISTDSNYAAKYIHREFADCHCVYTVKEFKIGHSAAAANQGGKQKWKQATQRAIVDLMILKDSDFLVYSKKSSYGKFAHELQLAKTSPIHVEPFLRQHGLKCSVFQYNQTSKGSASV